MRHRLAMALMVVVLSACAPAVIPTPNIPTPTPVLIPTETVTWVYPETYTSVVNALARAYQQTHPTHRIVLVPRAETLAWEALSRGEADIALVMNVPEGTAVWTQRLASDGLALIVHPFNGVPGLTLQDVQQLLAGQVSNWTHLNGPEGAPQVVSREEAAGETQILRQRVLSGNRVTLTALLAPSTDLMLEAVAAEPLAVGYVMQSRLTSAVRSVAIEGIPPTPETIAAGLYPLRVDLWLVAPAAPTGGALADWVAWLQSPEARTLLQGAGLVW